MFKIGKTFPEFSKLRDKASKVNLSRRKGNNALRGSSKSKQIINGDKKSLIMQSEPKLKKKPRIISCQILVELQLINEIIKEARSK